MKPWKLVLGAGAACAACCAVPLVSGAAALGLAGSGLFAGGMGAFAAYKESWLPVAAAAVALAAVAGLAAWRRRRPAQRAGACGCGSATEGAPACGWQASEAGPRR